MINYTLVSQNDIILILFFKMFKIYKTIKIIFLHFNSHKNIRFKFTPKIFLALPQKIIIFKLIIVF